MSWSATQYLAFEDERTRPVRDLLSGVPTAAASLAIDLGCGPGNSTELLAARYPGAEIRGMDNAPDMIAAARKRLPALRFDLADVSTWDEPGPFDVLLSNAVMQWVPGHATLFPSLAARLAPGGSLAIQMPDNIDEPAHRLMRDVAAAGIWGGALDDMSGTRTAVESVDWYYALLKPLCPRVDIWRTTYHHVLPGGANAVVEWFKGSGLRPFLAPLDAAQKAEFLARYTEGVAREYPALPDGAVLLPFPRLFIVATK